MRSILTETHFLGNQLFVLACLRYEENQMVLRIGLFGFECVLFNLDEWNYLIGAENHFKSYFKNKNNSYRQAISIPNFEILFNVTHKKEIIIRNIITWNTVRINEYQFNKLINFSPCIKLYCDEISEKVRYSNKCMQFIISDLTTRTLKELEVSKTLYDQCSEEKNNPVLPKPPKLQPIDVKNELDLLMAKTKDKIIMDICATYYDDIITEVMSKISYKTDG